MLKTILIKVMLKLTSYSNSKQSLYNCNTKNYSSFKLLIILVFLTFLPYLKITKILVLITSMFLMKKNKPFYLHKSNSLIIQSLLIVLYIIFLNQFFQYNMTELYLSNETILYLPYRIQTNFFNENKAQTLKILLLHIYFILPRYVKIILQLNVNYIVLIYNLSIFIKKEVLFKSFLVLLYKIDSCITFLICNSIISITLSNQILDNLLNNTNFLYIGIKIKRNKCKQQLTQEIKYIINCSSEIILKLIRNYSNTLWSKSIETNINLILL